MAQSPRPRLRIDVWSDVACPWCWVGKRHLEQAASSLGLELDLSWHAFQLDPGAPSAVPLPFDYLGALARKYGQGREQMQAFVDRMEATGEAAGLRFRFDRVQPVNTFDAHRLLAWAKDRGCQDALKERLFHDYMVEGRRVSDPDVLVNAAEAVGLDPEAASALVASNDRSEQVREDRATAAELGVSGVPFFVVEERYAVSGAQPVHVLARVLSRALDERDPAPTTDAGACGPDGCSV